jgi:hypothetical protein
MTYHLAQMSDRVLAAIAGTMELITQTGLERTSGC